MKTIKVGIADDHPIVLIGVASVLKDQLDMEVVFSCNQIGQLLSHVQEQGLNVLLCDFEFESDPQADGLHLLQRLRRMAPALRLIVLSAHCSPAIVSAAMELGAAGFIGKSRADFSNLANAVRIVAGGGLYVPPHLSSTLLTLHYSKKRTVENIKLSPKEVSVAWMTSNGLTISEIAERLKRSPKTISNQKVAAMKKLGAKNDVELAALLQELGL